MNVSSSDRLYSEYHCNCSRHIVVVLLVVAAEVTVCFALLL